LLLFVEIYKLNVFVIGNWCWHPETDIPRPCTWWRQKNWWLQYV